MSVVGRTRDEKGGCGRDEQSGLRQKQLGGPKKEDSVGPRPYNIGGTEYAPHGRRGRKHCTPMLEDARPRHKSCLILCPQRLVRIEAVVAQASTLLGRLGKERGQEGFDGFRSAIRTGNLPLFPLPDREGQAEVFAALLTVKLVDRHLPHPLAATEAPRLAPRPRWDPQPPTSRGLPKLPDAPLEPLDPGASLAQSLRIV